MRSFDIIVGVKSDDGGIGKAGTIPWYIKDDMIHFRNTTTRTSNPVLQNAVIMGRATWESLQENNRPLARRLNIVLTSDPDTGKYEPALTAHSLDDALAIVANRLDIENVFVIGGEKVYAEALLNEHLHRVYVTRIFPKDFTSAAFECDRFFPIQSLAFFKLTYDGPLYETDAFGYKFQIFTNVIE